MWDYYFAKEFILLRRVTLPCLQGDEADCEPESGLLQWRIKAQPKSQPQTPNSVSGAFISPHDTPQHLQKHNAESRGGVERPW